MQLRPVQLAETPCKVCGGPTFLFGVVDFARASASGREVEEHLVGQPVYYRRCGRCGLIYTDAFDDWSDADFLTHIYNDGYLALDPDYVEARPAASARMVIESFGQHAANISVVDFGAGNGGLVARLREAGFRRAEAYDPFTPEFAARPEGKFELVTCFETLEHVPDPKATVAELAALVADDGLVLFSTLVQPADIERQGLNWWYVGPRNGHITLYTRECLATLWGEHGFTVGSFDDNTHVACRELPAFAAHLRG